MRSSDGGQSSEQQPTTPRKPYRCPSFSMGAPPPGVDLTKANQLAAALEDEALIEKLRQGR